MSRLRVNDFETTGMEPPAAVVEVGMCDLVQQADGSWEVESAFDSWLCGGVDAMPAEVRAVHHITLEDVEGLSAFDRADIFRDSPAAIVAHNYAFEAAFLGEHGLPTVCTLKAALRIWPDAPNHQNQTLRYWLEDQGLIPWLPADLSQPSHRAGPDAFVTAHILRAILNTGVSSRELVAWTKEPRLLPTCPIGKFRGKPWADVEAGFLGWMLKQPDMDRDLVWNAQRELDRRAGR